MPIAEICDPLLSIFDPLLSIFDPLLSIFDPLLSIFELISATKAMRLTAKWGGVGCGTLEHFLHLQCFWTFLIFLALLCLSLEEEPTLHWVHRLRQPSQRMQHGEAQEGQKDSQKDEEEEQPAISMQKHRCQLLMFCQLLKE